MSSFNGCLNGCFGCVGGMVIVTIMLVMLNVLFAGVGFPTWLICGFSAAIVFLVGGSTIINLLNSLNR